VFGRCLFDLPGGRKKYNDDKEYLYNTTRWHYLSMSIISTAFHDSRNTNGDFDMLRGLLDSKLASIFRVYDSVESLLFLLIVR